MIDEKKLKIELFNEVNKNLSRLLYSYNEILEKTKKINSLVKEKNLKDAFWIEKINKNSIQEKELKSKIVSIEETFNIEIIKNWDGNSNINEEKKKEVIVGNVEKIVGILLDAVKEISNKRNQLKDTITLGNLSVDDKKKYIKELRKIDDRNKKIFKIINVEYVFISYDDLKENLNLFSKH